MMVGMMAEISHQPLMPRPVQTGVSPEFPPRVALRSRAGTGDFGRDLDQAALTVEERFHLRQAGAFGKHPTVAAFSAGIALCNCVRLECGLLIAFECRDEVGEHRRQL